MFCQKCGAEQKETSGFCAKCGNALGSQTLSTTPARKKGNPLIVILAILGVLLLLFIGYVMFSDDPATDSDSDETTISAANVDDEKDDNKPTNETSATAPEETETTTSISDDNSAPVKTDRISIDNFLAGTQDSSGVIVELVRDIAVFKGMGSSAEGLSDVEKMMDEQFYLDFLNAFDVTTIEPIDYPFNFIPEYRVIFDNGLTYTVMADTIGGERYAIIKVEGNDSLWIGPGKIYPNILPTTLDDDYAFMHIFETAERDDEAAAAVAKHGLICASIMTQYNAVGFEFGEGSDCILDDAILGEPMADLPQLRSAMIPYSLKPSMAGTLPDNPNLYKEDGWIKGGVVVAAIWTKKTDAGTRCYLLGVDPFVFDVNGLTQDEAAIPIYERSYATNLVK